jgi:hypothetical protein
VAHTCTSRYFKGRDQEGHGLRLAWANSLQDTLSPKMDWRKMDWRHAIEHLFFECKALNSNPSSTKKQKRKKKELGMCGGSCLESQHSEG